MSHSLSITAWMNGSLFGFPFAISCSESHIVVVLISALPSFPGFDTKRKTQFLPNSAIRHAIRLVLERFPDGFYAFVKVLLNALLRKVNRRILKRNSTMAAALSCDKSRALPRLAGS